MIGAACTCFSTNLQLFKAGPEPADLQWLGQKTRVDYNLLMCYGITSLAILWSLGIAIHTN